VTIVEILKSILEPKKDSLMVVSRETGVDYSALWRFVRHGEVIRLDKAEKLLTHYGYQIIKTSYLSELKGCQPVLLCKGPSQKKRPARAEMENGRKSRAKPPAPRDTTLDGGRKPRPRKVHAGRADQGGAGQAEGGGK